MFRCICVCLNNCNNELIKQFEDKYGLNRENAIKKISSRQQDKVQLTITSFGGALQFIANAAKLFL